MAKAKARGNIITNVNPRTIIGIITISFFSFLIGYQIRDYYSPQKVTAPTEIKQQIEQYPEYVTVARIIDGDTVEIADGRKLRYIGFNSPERGKEGYKEAIELNRQLVEGKEIRLEYEPKYRVDQYDRLLAYPWIKSDIKTLTKPNEQEEINVSLELTRQGLGVVAIYKDRAKLIYQDELFEGQDLAKKEKLGVWGK